MPYDPELLYLESSDEDEDYLIDVWYDGKYLGTVDSEEEAHELAVNYAIRND